MLFLHKVAFGESYRSIAVKHQRSLTAIGQAFHHVLGVLVRRHKELVKPPLTSAPHVRVQKEGFELFEGAIGALDGTHVPVHV